MNKAALPYSQGSTHKERESDTQMKKYSHNVAGGETEQGCKEGEGRGCFCVCVCVCVCVCTCGDVDQSRKASSKAQLK